MWRSCFPLVPYRIFKKKVSEKKKRSFNVKLHATVSIKHHTFNTVKITFLFRDRDRSVPLLSNAVTFAFLGVQLCPAFISVLLMLWSFQRVLERSITVIERSGTAIKSKGHFRTPRDARITGLEKTGNGMVTVMEQKRYLHCSIGIYGKMTESVRYYTIWYTARNTVLIFALLSSCFQELCWKKFKFTFT
jgi:hypothetical protein